MEEFSPWYWKKSLTNFFRKLDWPTRWFVFIISIVAYSNLFWNMITHLGWQIALGGLLGILMVNVLFAYLGFQRFFSFRFKNKLFGYGLMIYTIPYVYFCWWAELRLYEWLSPMLK